MRDRDAYDTDVLIVGAGPVGLFLANECARRSLRYRIVEIHASQSEHSKALAIMPRTMEIFDMAGLAQPFAAAANRTTAASVFAHGRRLARLAFEPEGTPYPYVAMVPQNVTEKLLVQALQHRGGRLEYGTTLTGAVQDTDAVSATLECEGVKHEIRARYLVGCDGAHSTVRHLLDLPFDGAQYSASFALADTETNEALPADEMQLCPHEDGPIAIFPMSATRRRIVATVDGRGGETAPSLDLVRALLARRGPEGMEARAVGWSSYFSVHHRQVSHMCAGRAFLAGDAAHIHSPFGGQGMNTGLQDVWNLVWKLELAVRGFASPELLESYSAERHRVAMRVIKVTDALTKVMGSPSKLAQSLRDALVPAISKFGPFQHAFVSNLSELGVAYDGSPLVEGHGERFFDDSLRGGRGIASRFIVFLGAGVSAPAAQEAQQLAASHPDLLEIRRTAGDGVTLVRPDGYAALATTDGRAGTIARVRSLLERSVLKTALVNP